MRVFCLRSIAVIGLLGCFVATLSCAHDQQLISIEVQPTTENFGAVDPTLGPVQLVAYGHYIHPPVTKDITSQVAWSSNTPAVAVVTSTGALSPGGVDCGNAIITATVKTNSSAGGRSSSGALITGSMTANVTCAGAGGAGSGGGGSGTSTLTIQFNGAGSGVVTSTPMGLSCVMAPCTTSFNTGTTVSISAAPNSGSTFGAWSGCDGVSGTTCSVTMNNNRTITVTFN
ncbi:MAG TPA: hypothetical protein VF133_11120 [Terriglobales bacterium]